MKWIVQVFHLFWIHKIFCHPGEISVWLRKDMACGMMWKFFFLYKIPFVDEVFSVLKEEMRTRSKIYFRFISISQAWDTLNLDVNFMVMLFIARGAHSAKILLLLCLYMYSHFLCNEFFFVRGSRGHIMRKIVSGLFPWILLWIMDSIPHRPATSNLSGYKFSG